MAEPDYKEFNNFQTYFYTNINEFGNYTKFEIKKHGIILLINLAKGYPYLADMFINLRGIGWNAFESPAVLQALQRRFINNFNKAVVPQYIYFKGTQKETKSKEKVKQTKDGLVFSDDINTQIQTILMYDLKTFDYLKFSDKVQKLGKQLIGEFMQKEKVKQVRKRGGV